MSPPLLNQTSSFEGKRISIRNFNIQWSVSKLNKYKMLTHYLDT